MTRRRDRVSLFFTTLFMGSTLCLSTACEDEGVVEIAPQLLVDACQEPPVEIDGTFFGGVEDCAVDFGQQDISVRGEHVIRLSNPTSVALEISQLILTSDSDPSFTLERAPTSIEPGLTVQLVVGFRPNVEDGVSGRIVISSDAANVADGQDVIIDLVGTGVDNGIPDAVIAPSRCDFGNVAVGGVKECLVRVENKGGRTLLFDSVAFLDEADGKSYPVTPNASEGTPFEFVGRPPQEGDAVAAPPEFNQVEFAVLFAPDALGLYEGILEIRINDPEHPIVRIGLDGLGVDPPECKAEIISIDGVPVVGSPTIEPLDIVILSVENSVASSTTSEIVSAEWEIVEQPGLGAALTDPFEITTGFIFDGTKLGIPDPGRYRVKAKVVDDLGTESINECMVEFDAIPTDALHVQLNWGTAYGDMDLHLIRQDDSGDYCANGVEPGASALAENCGRTVNDCFYGNCKAEGPDQTWGPYLPVWDDDPDDEQNGNPSLDVDDLAGYGPENINLDTVGAGNYLIAVHYFLRRGGPAEGPAPVDNRVQVYLFGQLKAEFLIDLNDNDWWEAGVIKWSDDIVNEPPCVEDLGTSTVECP